MVMVMSMITVMKIVSIDFILLNLIEEGIVYPVYRNFNKLKVINLTSFCETRMTGKNI